MKILALGLYLFVLLFAKEIRCATSSAKSTTQKPSLTTTTNGTNRPTTTTQPPYPFCRNFNKIKENFLAVTMPEDFIIGERGILAEMLDERDQARGIFAKRGYKIYYDSMEKVNYKKAIESCLLRKMELLALDTAKELNDPYFGSEFRKLDIMHFNDTDADMEFLWTSAVPCSKSDPLNKATNSCSSVTWCSNNVETVLSYSLNLGQVHTRPYCMIYRRSTQQLEPMDCSFEALFLCEHSCSKPNCPPSNQCKKDDSLFQVVDGRTFLKKENYILGTWERSKDNIFYFLGEKLVSWSENWKTCCSLGLKPIAMNDWTSHFDRTNSPMQGIVYWTAMTRSNCPYQFENCFHDDVTEPFSQLTVNGIATGGSCVAISMRDSATKKKWGMGLAVKTFVCNSKLLLGCQGPEQTFQVKNEDSLNCDLPECRGIANNCYSDRSNFLLRPFPVLLAPQRLGKWLSACDHSFLQPPNPDGTWDEAYKRCCSVGMDLLSIQNPAKQICLASSSKTRLPFSGQFWTSGRDIGSCPGKLRWCTNYLNDFLKKDLVWKAGQDLRFSNNSCVYIDFDDPILPSLALADCSERKQFFCEAPSGAGFKSQMHATFCRRSFNVRESEAIQIWNTSDLSKAGYGAKVSFLMKTLQLNIYKGLQQKMIQCLAEYIGLVHNSTKINEHVYFEMVSRMLSPLDMNTIQDAVRAKTSFLQSFALSSLAKFKILLMLSTFEVMEQYFSAHFQLSADMINTFFVCKNISELNDATFAFDFLRCLLQSPGMATFWKVYDFGLEENSVVPMFEEIGSPCYKFQGLLKISNSCIPANFLTGLTPTGPFVSYIPINVNKVGSSSFIACLERNGSLPYAETKEIFVALYNYFRSVAPNLMIVWDHGYSVNGSSFVWCRSDVDPLNPSSRIPVPVPVTATTNKIPLMLVSLPGKEPNLHAVPVTETLKYDTDVFCRFSPSVVVRCEEDVNAATWDY